RRSQNVAKPLTAVTVIVPLHLPPPCLLPTATSTPPMYTLSLYDALPISRTFTAGLIWRPAIVVLGGVPNTSCVAVPAVIVKELLVVELNPVADAVGQYPLRLLSRIRSPKLATQLTAATVVGPPRLLSPAL